MSIKKSIKRARRRLRRAFSLWLPDPNISYRYKLIRQRSRVATPDEPLTTEELATRNRGDPKLQLDETRVESQVPILDRYFAFLRDLVRRERNISVLDVGCRDGYLLQRLRDDGVEKLTGFEIVPEWVSHCHRQNRDFVENVNLLELDVDAYPKFDLVFTRHTMEHVDRVALFFENLVALTKPGGQLFVVFPLNPKPSFKHPSELISIEHVNELLDFSALQLIHFGPLKDFPVAGVEGALVDEREGSEILIYARKSAD